MKSTQTFALGTLIALLLTSGFTQARDWQWYPRKAPTDSGALRPDLEGTRDEQSEQREMSELEELRHWLRRRDEDRRQQGITVPDTVEQLEPAGDLAARRRQWPESSTHRSPTDSSSGAIVEGEPLLDEQSQRVRDTLFPQSYGKSHSHFSRRTWRHRSSSSSRRLNRHQAPVSSRKRGSTRQRH